MKAEMQLTILEDGTISIQTGNMAGEHHASADEFIKLVHQLAGGAAKPNPLGNITTTITTITMNTAISRERIAGRIDNTFFELYDGGRPGQACLYWAHYTVQVLTALGVRAIIQAGSASWPRLRPDQDDGVSPTHHSYVWEPDSAVTKARLAAGAMPELHVWAAIPQRGEIIDMTTRFWPEQCLLIQQRDWPGDKPPNYFWGTANDLPEGVLYAPDMKAIALALHLLKGEST